MNQYKNPWERSSGSVRPFEVAEGRGSILCLGSAARPGVSVAYLPAPTLRSSNYKKEASHS
jgi:hypothetical protein